MEVETCSAGSLLDQIIVQIHPFCLIFVVVIDRRNSFENGSFRQVGFENAKGNTSRY